MENVSTSQPARSARLVHGARAAALGLLVNSALCLCWPMVTAPGIWLPNIAFAVFTVHLMGWVFRDFFTQPRTVSANTLGFALSLIMPLSYLSQGG